MGSAPSVDFSLKQAEFAAYIRNPEQNPVPADVSVTRMAMYRELFINNIDGFLSGNFPVLRKILNDEQWQALVHDFFATHRCTSPHFSDVPEEFLAYLQYERQNVEDLPFLLELAHYEWVEMALAIAQEELSAPHVLPDDLLNQPITVSPLAWPLAYQYPVHKITPAYLPLTPPAQPTFLIVYRNRADDVNFLEITPMTYRLLAMLQEQPLAEQCLQQIAAESQHPDPERIKAAGLQILEDLVEKTVICIGI